MNKYQEAMKIYSCLEHEYTVGQFTPLDYQKARLTLKELVDRATPKKPEEKILIRKDNYRDGTNIPRYDWWCSNCHLEHMGTNIIKFCPSCGQALDWRDEE